MREIWIPEAVIGLFYLLFILRFPVRKLRSLEGLVWMPPAALAISLALFPAYGFRSEVIPLVIYGLVINLFNLPSLGAGRRRRQDGDFLVHGAFFTLGNTLFFAVVMALAFWFSPLGETALDSGVRMAAVRDDARGREYFFRLYGEGADRPLLVLLPSPLGSVLVLDKLCGELESRGFTVLTYSRRQFDSPAVGEHNWIYPGSLAALFRRFFLLPVGTRTAGANELGRALEQGRQEDLEFILSYLRGSASPAAPGQPLFLAGYGAGGSALIWAASSPGFVSRNPGVRGLIAVESLLWSAYEEQEPPEEFLPSNPGLWGRVLRRWYYIRRWFVLRMPKKLALADRLPAPELPLMVLLSDRVRDPRYRESDYGAILGSLTASRKASLLVIADGAGPLDYTDCPRQYPLLSALFPGTASPPWNNGDFTGGAADLMAGFADSVLRAAGGRAGTGLSPGRVPAQGLHTGQWAWNLGDPGYIVKP